MSNLNLTPVQSANDSSTDFKIKWYPEKDEFKISDTLFGQLGLEHKGLQQFNGEDGVYLGVKDEENSVFLKRKGNSNKGRSFKNKNLSNSLKDYKYSTEENQVDLDVEFAGNYTLGEEEIPVYKIILSPEIGISNTSSEVSSDKYDKGMDSVPAENDPSIEEKEGFEENNSGGEEYGNMHKETLNY